MLERVVGNIGELNSHGELKKREAGRKISLVKRALHSIVFGLEMDSQFDAGLDIYETRRNGVAEERRILPTDQLPFHEAKRGMCCVGETE